MASKIGSPSVSRVAFWLGWVLSILPALFLLLDAARGRTCVSKRLTMFPFVNANGGGRPSAESLMKNAAASRRRLTIY
jgi:hypothetical protein